MTDNERGRGLNVLSKPELARRLDQLISELLDDGRGNDATRDLLLELQTHQVELELQGRELADARHILEVSRDHYARLFDLAPVGFAVFDRRGRIREINLTAAQMLGRDRLRLGGTPFPVLLASGEMRRFLDHVSVVISGAEGTRIEPLDVDLEARRPRPGPAPQSLRLVSSRRHGDQGPECFSALVDITAERRLERSKVATEHRAHAILDALPAEVLVLDAKGRIVLANEAWRCFADCLQCSTSGSSAQRADVGCDYLAACRDQASRSEAERPASGAETAAIADGVAAVLERRRHRFVAEYACERRDGEHWLALTAAPLDAEGDEGEGNEAEGEETGQGAVIVQIDVTDRKRAEQNTQIARETAAHAARVNAVGVLATSLVHELAQPLNAASFFGRAALEQLQGFDAKQRSAEAAMLEPMIAKADAQLERASAIVERLRHFLRHKEVRMQPVELDPLIERTLELIGWFASQRQVELEFASGSAGLWLLGDPVQLEQVMVNLICNAVQAIHEAEMPVRQVTIATGSCTSEVSLMVQTDGQTDTGSPMVQVTVSDTGPGLAVENEHALFDLFASRRSSGLGMGLPISRDIVEAHGGKLWADPSSSVGACFHFKLPLAQAGGE
ncbi:MAG: ATP-binding protein [Lamprobacter sp.]|uniref:PAS domain-containing sensor histidine kinase n=1 Tax=Lamprobacter sp. TaxID=3100796 RepID=UPI002B25F152|nr:ATP-binding protein [Lamprobacter sp.]MEA3641636.1 ATP-binding protein [Lamprobacter sp.]